MNCPFPFWGEKGEWFGAFTRLIFRVFSRRFLGDELQVKTEKV
jgi:hypothetical protein